ncbi:MAG: hypothetical protein F6K24_10835 [Okeania sp. SIO2D1]|nr:hypothetical protein [Okeania sp. SIO2D1]
MRPRVGDRLKRSDPATTIARLRNAHSCEGMLTKRGNAHSCEEEGRGKKA